MITILKIPLYLEVESEPQDRAKVTRAVQSILLPLVIKHFKAKGLMGFLDRGAAEKVKAELGDIDLRLLSDVEAMTGK